VLPVTVDDITAAMRDPDSRIQLAAGATGLDYPDPASFLAQMLGKDIPATWLQFSTRDAVARLAGLSGAARDRAALAFAARLATRDVPIVAYGTPALGTLVGPRLGCRTWNGIDSGFDLAALCLSTS
jgi:hypothetical protein